MVDHTRHIINRSIFDKIMQINDGIVKVFLKQKKARKAIMEYLEPSDWSKLSQTCKKMKKVVLSEKENPVDANSFQFLIKKMLKKAEKKPDGNYVKGSLFDLDPNIIQRYKWVLLNPTEETNNRIAKDIGEVIPSKLVKDYAWFIYYCEELKKFLAVHRSIVDSSLEFFFKENERIRSKEIVEEDEHEKYAKVLEEFDVQKFSGVQHGMLIRHQLLTEKMKKIDEEISEKKQTADTDSLVQALNAKLMTYVLCQGGSFSVGVFDKEKEVTHKSDHKYVIRKKQGKRQSTKDKGKSISSMGSQIRRANEVKHQENIGDILDGIKEWLSNSDYVFIHAPGENASILFDEGKSLFEFKRKQHFKSLCQTTKKANYEQIKSIREHILKVYIITEDDRIAV